jgi:hypothetical protein
MNIEKKNDKNKGENPSLDRSSTSFMSYRLLALFANQPPSISKELPSIRD